MFVRILLVALLMLIGFGVEGEAASLRKHKLVVGDQLLCDYIFEGEIQQGDEKQFEKLEGEYICLDSEGGSFATALDIAEKLTYNPYGSKRTRVLADNKCLSACSIIFMAGVGFEDAAYPSRTLEVGAELGFHAPYIDLPDSSDGYDSDTVERAYDISVLQIGRLIKLSNVKYEEGNAVIPLPLLDRFLKFGRTELYRITTIEDVLISHIDLLPEPKIENSQASRKNVCDNDYWMTNQNSANFEATSDLTLSETKWDSNKQRDGKNYDVFSGYYVGEGTYTSCYVEVENPRQIMWIEEGIEDGQTKFVPTLYAFDRRTQLKDLELNSIGPRTVPNATDQIVVAPAKPEELVLHRNSDARGLDIKAIKGISSDACRSSCLLVNTCAGITHDRWNSLCILKGSISSLKMSAKSDVWLRNGILVEIKKSKQEMLRRKSRVFPDNPYRSIPNIDYEKCSAACTAEAQCLAINHHRNGLCDLLATASEYKENSSSDIAYKNEPD